jgi:hypothetical protein
MSATIERLFIYISVLVAAAIVWLGARLATATGDPHWLNRAGALIVCVESLLLLVEFYRRNRLRQIEEEAGDDNPYIARESMRAERQLIAIGVSMAVAGELLHGFGDLFFETLAH